MSKAILKWLGDNAAAISLLLAVGAVVLVVFASSGLETDPLDLRIEAPLYAFGVAVVLAFSSLGISLTSNLLAWLCNGCLLGKPAKADSGAALVVRSVVTSLISVLMAIYGVRVIGPLIQPGRSMSDEIMILDIIVTSASVVCLSEGWRRFLASKLFPKS